jgi:glutaconyl-CoA/methylmalonyl-CoA decarboxylase subunit gamma
MKYHLEINQKNFDVTISGIAGNSARVQVNGQPYVVHIGRPPKPDSQRPATQPPGAVKRTNEASATVQSQKHQASILPVLPSQSEPILAPIPGLILEIKVKVGEIVSAGQSVAVLEAMKMENSLITHVSGMVKEIRFEKGSEVSTGDVILIVG